MFKQTIRTNIITMFLLLLSFVSFSLIYTQYYFNYNLAVQTTTKTFKLVGENILDEIKKRNDKLENLLHANIFNASFQKKISFNTTNPAAHDLIRMLSVNPGLYAMYFAQKDGSFYEVINMQESDLLYTYFQAPKETRWLILTSIGEKTQYTYLDKFHKIIQSTFSTRKSKALSRPWYKKAVASKKLLITEPYLFEGLQEMGTSYVLQTTQKGTVFGIDYSMQSINKFLQIQNFNANSEIFLFNKDGRKLVSSNPAESKNNILPYKKISPYLLQAVEENYDDILKYSEENTHYFSLYIPLGG